MTTTGTIIATIAAGAATAVADGSASLASTSTDNSIAWTRPWMATDIANCEWWLDADSVGDLTITAGTNVVTQVRDRSGGGRHSTPSSSAWQSSTGYTQNGRRKLRNTTGGAANLPRSAGTNISIATSRAITLAFVCVDEPSAGSALFVLSPVSGQDHQGVVVNRGGGNLFLDIGTGAAYAGASSLRSYSWAQTTQTAGLDVPRLIIVRASTTAVSLRVNGTDKGAGTVTNSMALASFWGTANPPLVTALYRRDHSSGQYPATGLDYFEAAVYTRYISDAECATIETEMAAKWGTFT